MPEYGIVIQARSRATRLPDKVLLPFYRDRTILEIITANLLDQVPDVPLYIATTTHEADDRIEDLATRLGVVCVRGDEQHVLSRFILAGTRFGLCNIVRVCADNPFLDAGAVQGLISAHTHMPHKPDYLSYEVAAGLPAIRSHIGIFAELAAAEALQRIPVLTDDVQYFEHVTNFLYTHPGLFDIRFLPAPDVVYGRTDVRLTIDTREDFELLQQVYSATAHREQSISSVINYLDGRTDILEKMRNLISANEK